MHAKDTGTAIVAIEGSGILAKAQRWSVEWLLHSLTKMLFQSIIRKLIFKSESW
jgi:hypothetical protein